MNKKFKIKFKIIPNQLTPIENGVRTAKCPNPDCRKIQYFERKETITGGTYNCAYCLEVYRLEPVGYDTNYN
jgi:hypothetical protein